MIWLVHYWKFLLNFVPVNHLFTTEKRLFWKGKCANNRLCIKVWLPTAMSMSKKLKRLMDVSKLTAEQKFIRCFERNPFHDEYLFFVHTIHCKSSESNGSNRQWLRTKLKTKTSSKIYCWFMFKNCLIKCYFSTGRCSLWV